MFRTVSVNLTGFAQRSAVSSRWTRGFGLSRSAVAHE
jgi:hypothetical protein